VRRDSLRVYTHPERLGFRPEARTALVAEAARHA
jgi:hypothetical protein